MEKQFWEEKWEAQELGFHLSFVHPILKRNLAAFDLPAGATVFLPLCGKTLEQALMEVREEEILAGIRRGTAALRRRWAAEQQRIAGLEQVRGTVRCGTGLSARTQLVCSEMD